MKFPKLSLWVIGLLQSGGFFLYVMLFGLFVTHSKFDSSPTLFAPALFLLIFAFSAIVTTSMVLGYPFYLFWVKKNFGQAVRLIIYTASWLLVFIAVVLSILIFVR